MATKKKSKTKKKIAKKITPKPKKQSKKSTKKPEFEKENSIKEEKNVLSICNMPKSEMKKVSEYLYGTAY